MRIVLMPFIVLLPLLALSACNRTMSSHPPSKGNSPASEKMVYAALGRGLMGEEFEKMGRADRRKALQAEYQALEYSQRGQTISWEGGNHVNSGVVTVRSSYKVGSQNCRQYDHNFNIGGVEHQVSASACRNEDGSWTPLL